LPSFSAKMKATSSCPFDDSISAALKSLATLWPCSSGRKPFCPASGAPEKEGTQPRALQIGSHTHRLAQRCCRLHLHMQEPAFDTASCTAPPGSSHRADTAALAARSVIGARSFRGMCEQWEEAGAIMWRPHLVHEAEQLRLGALEDLLQRLAVFGVPAGDGLVSASVVPDFCCQGLARWQARLLQQEFRCMRICMAAL